MSGQRAAGAGAHAVFLLSLTFFPVAHFFFFCRPHFLLAAAAQVRAELPLHRTFALSIIAGCFVGFGGLLAATVGGCSGDLVTTNPGSVRLASL